MKLDDTLAIRLPTDIRQGISEAAQRLDRNDSDFVRIILREALRELNALPQVGGARHDDQQRPPAA